MKLSKNFYNKLSEYANVLNNDEYYEVNKKLAEQESNTEKDIEFQKKEKNTVFLNLLKILFSTLSIIGYTGNFFAIYNHWSLPLTIQYLAEFVGIIIFPIGIVTGWFHIV